MSHGEADSGMRAAEMFMNDPGGIESPQAVAAIIRDQGPVCRTSKDPYLVTGYEEAQAIYKDRRFSSAAASGRIAGWLNAYPVDPGKLSIAVTMFGHMIQESDDPKHARLRTAIRPAFSARAVERWQPTIDRIVRSLVGEVSARPTFDVVETLAYPLPCHVMSQVMGLPFADHEKWEAWTVAIAELSRTRPPSESEVSSLVDAA
jgi:cytochrome P450